MITHGMNIDEVENLGRYLKGRGRAIDEMCKQIEQRVSQATAWRGGRAERFRGSEWPRIRAQLDRMAEDLDRFGRSALDNAAEQRRASEATDGGPTPGGNQGRWFDPSQLGVLPAIWFEGPIRITYEDFAELFGKLSLFKDLWDTATGSGFTRGIANNLDGWAVLGAAISAGEIVWHGVDKGWGSQETIWSTIDGVGGTAAGLAAGPAGGLAWWASTQVGMKVGEGMAQADGVLTEWITGSDMGSDNARWMYRKYGVYDWRELTFDEQIEAMDALNDHRSGWRGLANYAVDPFRDAWFRLNN